MAYVIAQLSDIHIGGPADGSGERFSLAIDEINAMGAQPDLVLLTGDLTHDGTAEQWSEFTTRLESLDAPWTAIAGNHDGGIAEIAGHRAIDAGPLRLVLVDSSNEVFAEEDASWLDAELSAAGEQPTIIAIHHPPFETGIWWMDCVGLTGMDRFEQVVRSHPQVIKVLSGHVHRLIQTHWDTCALWVCPSTAVTVAVDLDAQHDPAETAEPPAFSLHAYTGSTIVSHLVAVGEAAERTSIADVAPGFVSWVRSRNNDRPTVFASTP